MKKHSLSIPILFFIVGILFGCTQNTKDADVEADIAEIRDLLDQYALAVSTDDIELFMTCWADGAKRMEPGYDVILGKENIRAHFKFMFDQFNSNVEFYGEFEIEVSDNLAFGQVNAIVSFSPKDGGPTNHLDLKVLDIYKRQADSSWKIYVDHVSNNPVWSNDSISSEMLDKQDPSDPVL